MKTYIQSPLPFQGQNRRFLKHFKEALKEIKSAKIYSIQHDYDSGISEIEKRIKDKIDLLKDKKKKSGKSKKDSKKKSK